MKIVPLILCGGSGTRLWPASRSSRPKQFLPLLDGRSLYQETLLRASGEEFARPVVVTGHVHRFIAAEQANEIGVSIDILLEPEARNSGPAFAAGAAYISNRDGASAPLLAMAADHLVRDVDAAKTSVLAALPTAEAGHIVTFGIVPTSPSTAYGYIELAEPLDEKANVTKVARFVEKPNAVAAPKLVEAGCLWNSGNFLARADTLLSEYEVFDPETTKAAVAAVDRAEVDLDFRRLDASAFAECRSLSIDYAVMERSKKLAVIRAGFDWSDVGSWGAIQSLFERDANGNASLGPFLPVDADNNIVQSDGPLVVAAGVEDLVIVVTADAVLVTKSDDGATMRAVTEAVRSRSPHLLEDHLRSYRPWGNYVSLDHGTRHQVKNINVKPGGILSLQHHHHRSEHWVVVRGTARVTLGEKILTLHENESVYIPSGTVHRLENPGKIALELIEVQTGSYLGEDDIIRHEDIYSRTS